MHECNNRLQRKFSLVKDNRTSVEYIGLPQI